jgi:hypothetical protein
VVTGLTNKKGDWVYLSFFEKQIRAFCSSIVDDFPDARIKIVGVDFELTENMIFTNYNNSFFIITHKKTGNIYIKPCFVNNDCLEGDD